MLEIINESAQRAAWLLKLNAFVTGKIHVKNPEFCYKHHWGYIDTEDIYTFVITNAPIPDDLLDVSSDVQFSLDEEDGISTALECANELFLELLQDELIPYHYQVMTIKVDHAAGIGSPFINSIISSDERNAPTTNPLKEEAIAKLLEAVTSLKKKDQNMIGNVQFKSVPTPPPPSAIPKKFSNRMSGLLTLILEKVNYAGMFIGAHLNKSWTTDVSPHIPNENVLDRIGHIKYSQNSNDEVTGQPLGTDKFNHIIEVYWKEPMLHTDNEMVKVILYHPQEQSTYEKLSEIKLMAAPYWRPLYNYKKEEVVEALKIISDTFGFEFKN